MRAGWLSVGFLALVALGCHTEETFTTTGPQDCSTDVVGKFSPSDTTISVGATYTQRITLTTCSGTRTIVDTYTWSSNNPSKVTIDAQTGLVTAVGTGTATLTAIGSFYGSFVGGVITVK